MPHPILMSLNPDLTESKLSRSMRELTDLVAKRTRQMVETVSAIDGLRVSTDGLKYVYAPSGGVAPKVYAVIREAEKAKANVIVVGTQLKMGQVTGGFAEKLVHSSPIPVMLISPKTKVPHNIKKILFASNLDKKSMQVFRKLCQFASECKAEIKIVHAMFQDQEYLPFGTAIPTDLMPAKVVERDLNLAKARAARLVNFAQKQSVKTSLEIEPFLFSKSQVVLSAAKRWDPDIIALGSGSAGTLRGHLFGSTSVALIHKSTRPLWLYHAE